MNIKTKINNIKLLLGTPYKVSIWFFKRRMKYYKIYANATVVSSLEHYYFFKANNIDKKLIKKGFEIQDKKTKSILRSNLFQYTIEL